MFYKSKQILLASKHQKEKAIGPVFTENLGCQLRLSDFDTDQLGTFTGEIARPFNPYETCILKAKKAAQQDGHALALASEGSFGPHPANPFLPSAYEIMAFVDLTHNWVIAESLITLKTNYKMMTLQEGTDLDSFLQVAGFPDHALILQTEDQKETLGKGIVDPNELQGLLQEGFKRQKTLLLATDMRAMMNPTRMDSLATLARKLASRIATHCPSCDAPGFGFKTTDDQLPCGLCGSPTNMYRFEMWGCVRCDYELKKPRVDQLEKADPTYCHHCNP